MIFETKLLQDRKILIGISASVAIYKTLEIISCLKKLGAQIRVVMSEESQKFITPLCFEAITHTPVLHAKTESWNKNFDSKDQIPCNHISYAKWAEAILIVPATANTLAKIASGIADNLLLSTLLASNATKIIAPAMNTQMLQNPITQANLERLKILGFQIIPTRSGTLACDTTGDGALATIEDIVFSTTKELIKNSFWKNKQVIITGGGSKENIDLVRCISNHSSGLQASAIAIALYLLGANVKFISSAFPVFLPQEIQKTSVSSTEDYFEAITKNVENQQFPTYLFMTAAIADFIPKNPRNEKIKKQNQTELIIECKKNKDILESLQYPHLYKIGFKAEFNQQTALASAQKMLDQKKCFAVCLNVLSQHNAFGSDKNTITLISSQKSKTFSLDSKINIAFNIANFIASISSE